MINTARKVILVVSLSALLCLGLVPPWQQAAERETSFRKDLGRSLVFRPPAPVTVDCYFVGCKPAPASYFHTVLYRELLFAQTGMLSFIALIMFLMFRQRQNGSYPLLSLKKQRVIFSLLLSLLVPPTGTFPFGWILLEIPQELVHAGDLWLIPMVAVIGLFLACSFVIYALLTAILKATNNLSMQGS
jgi:hypothetical protein